jgi:hypothetical protein
MAHLTLRLDASAGLRRLYRICWCARGLLFSIVFIAIAGCTSVQLEHSTAGQTSTLSDITSQVVLNNLAMFRQNAYAVPAQVSITQGSIQITDLANPSFMYTWPIVSRVFGISTSRTWQESWTVVPVSDYATLKTLRDMYGTCAQGVAFHPGAVAFNEVKNLPGNEQKDAGAISSLSDCSSWLGFGNTPGGLPFGHYSTTFVWVKQGDNKDQNSQNAQKFGDFVMQVISASGAAAKTQAQVFPGAVLPPPPSR